MTYQKGSPFLGITSHLDHRQLPGFAELDMQELQEADSLLGEKTGLLTWSNDKI